jgi:DNA repair protein RecO (recombination protein O)
MDWRDEGIVLSVRPHGETAAIAELFTAAHGRHLGVVRGGQSRRAAAHLQPGAQVAVAWRARLADHIGTFALEPLRLRAAVLGDAAALAALGAACALLRLALPERAPHPALWRDTGALFDGLEEGGGWGEAYLRWELRLLEDIGFGLDLGTCAVTGAREGLAFVSPRTGRAVSRAAAGDWAGRLLPLPGLLGGEPAADDLARGLAISGHFLARALPGQPLPAPRERLVARLSAAAPADRPAG